MKQDLFFKSKLLVLIFLCCNFLARAAEPTLSASNINFTSGLIDGGQFQITFKAGNGTGRIIVVKEASDIINKPLDGNSYTTNSSPNAEFGVAGSELTTGSGEFVVYAGSSTTVTVTRLKPGTVYYVAIFEYNGTNATPSSLDYLPLTPTEQKVTTLVAPTMQAAITGFTQVAGNSARVNYTNGNGVGRIIVVRKGTTLTSTPTDLVSYNGTPAFKSTTSSSFYLDAESFVVLRNTKTAAGAADYADVTNLEPNTSYTFAIFEFNSSTSANTPVYLKPASIQTLTTNAGPTKAASSVGFTTVDGNRLTLNCAYGNGTRRVIIARKGTEVTAAPVNGNHYTANAQFGLGQEMGPGEYVVFDGASNSVTVTNLEKFTTYYFAVYEYDQDGNGSTYYLTSLPPATSNHSTALAPTNNTVLSIASLTGSSVQFKYNFPASGYGAYRMVVMKEGGPVDFQPQDLTLYNSLSFVFGNGQVVAPNTYVIIGQGNGGAPTVTGLTPGHTYYATVFDMNGPNAPVYLRPGSSVVINVPNEPTTGSTVARFNSIEGNSMSFSWNNGDGAQRIVVARKGAAVSSLPQDGITYTANAKFGTGSELNPGSGEFVVFDGTYNSVALTGLEKGTTYYFAVFEYNTSASGRDYLTAAGKWLPASAATLNTPAGQVSNLTAYNIQSNQASVTFTIGSGSSRLFIMREGAPVDAEPADFTPYFTNTSFGVASTQIGTGNYAVASGGAVFTVTGLKPGTQYSITAFEYNGYGAPVYLRPGVTTSFTTTGAISVPAPAQIAQSPVFQAIDGNKLTFKWTNGDGANRIVVARKASAVSFIPADGANYTANASFGSSTNLGAGQYVVYNGNGSSVAVANLEPSTQYYFSVFEYNGTSSGVKYGASALAATGSTAMPPAVISTSASSTIGSGAVTLKWTNGNGDGRIVVAREGSDVAGIPVSLNVYAANAVFQNGPQIAAGEYVVYAGTGNTVTVTGLAANKTYYFSVFEYNGVEAPVYNTASALKINATVSSVLPVTWVYVNAKEKNGAVAIEWATAQENNSSYFEVQRSADGIQYSAIAKINASGNSASNHYYSYNDVTASGTNYYRIKQVDVDGKSSYSKVLEVNGSADNKVQLLQNPVHDQVRLKCTEAQLGGLLVITDATGRVIRKATITSTQPVFETGKLQNGMYYASVQDKNGKGVITLPFIKQ